MFHIRLRSLVLFALCLGACRVALAADAPAADHRLEKLKDLNGYFPFTPPRSPAEWNERAEALRRQILLAAGLWPMPTATPANAVVHGAVDRDGYTVEKVFLESFPGHFVTGNLYRPKGKPGKRPGVLCPHGHWPNGRFYDAGEKAIKQSIVDGAERFEIGGRYPLQARCMQLARMGCVVFHYDMIGYADSVQLEHRAGSRPAMNTPENWGFFSPQAELRLQSLMGVQTYNSVRALDWFSQLPDVDAKRIAVTGASGGGTQTFVLCAIDPRPAVAFPAVMVSTAMQGGCTCENANYLRVETGNIEIAALTAPRPLGMTAADDWTKEIATKGLPELKQLYKVLGVPNLVMAKPLLQFPHNYNYVSREVMYQWMNKHLKLGLPEPVIEDDFKPLSIAELSVWDDKHPKPAAGDDYERSLVRWMTEDSRKQMDALVPRDAAGLKPFRSVVGGAYDTLIGRRLPAPEKLSAVLPNRAGDGSAEAVAWLRGSSANGGLRQMPLTICLNGERPEEVSASLVAGSTFNGRVVVWIGSQSNASAAKADGIGDEARRLASSGAAVLALDLFGQSAGAKNRLNASGQKLWKEYAGYTYGYNYPLFVERVHDILTAVAFARGKLGATAVDLVGLDGAGRWVAAARAQAGAAIDRAVADNAGFRFAKLTAIYDADFLPGGAKYLDVPGMLALSAPLPLWLSDAGADTSVVSAVYRAAGASNALVECAGATPATAAVDWLLLPAK